MRSDIEAGKAFIRLYLKQSELQRGLRLVQATLTNLGSGIAAWGRRIAGIGAAVAGPLTAAVASFTHTGDSVAKMAKRLGTGTEAVSELTYAIGQSGGSAEDLENGMRRMQQAIADARDGSQTAQKTLTDLGVTFDMLKETPDAQLEVFADRLSRIQDPAKRTALAMDVFGKSGTRLLPLFENGAAGIRDLRAEAVRLGQSISPEDARAAEELGDSWDRVVKTGKGAAFALGGALAPAVKDVLDSVTATTAGIASFIRENKEAVTLAAKTAAGLVIGGGAAYGLGKALTLVGGSFGTLRGMMMPALAHLANFRARVKSLDKIGPAVAKSLASIGRSAASALGTLGSSGAAGARFGAGFVGIGQRAGRMLAAGLVAGATAGASATATVGGVVGSRIASGLQASFARVPGFAATMANQVQASFNGLRSYAAAFGRGFTGEIGLRTSNAAAKFWQMGTLARAGLDRIAGAMPGVTGRIGAAVGQIRATTSAAFASVAGRVNAAMGRVSAAVAPVTSRVSAAWSTVAPRVAAAWSSISARVSGAMRPAVALASSAGARVVAAWRSVGPRMAAGVTVAMRGAFARITAMGRASARGVAGGAGALGRGIGGAIGGVGGVLAGLGGLATGGILGKLAALAPNIMAVGTAISTVLNPATLLLGVIGGGVYAWFKYSDAGKKAFATLKTALAPFVQIVKDTFTGISNALRAGDLSLAGKIAIAGLRIAFLEGLAKLSGAVGGVFGDMLGKIGAQIAGGDFRGAWNTTVQSMAAVWDAWAAGVVKTFTSAAKKVLDVWKKTVTAISDTLLAGAAADGFIGDTFKKIVGTDMGALQAQRDKMELPEQRHLIVRNIESAKADKEQELSLAVAAGDTAKIEELRQAIANYEADIAKVRGMPPVNLLDLATADVDRQLSGTVDAVGRAMDDLSATTAAKADAAGKALADKVAGGASMSQQAIADAKAELAAFNADAAKKAGEARKRSGAATEGERETFEGAATLPTGSAAATAQFSAAGLVAIGQGGGAADKTVAAINELRRLTKEAMKTYERIAGGIERLPGAIRGAQPRYK